MVERLTKGPVRGRKRRKISRRGWVVVKERVKGVIISVRPVSGSVLALTLKYIERSSLICWIMEP